MIIDIINSERKIELRPYQIEMLEKMYQYPAEVRESIKFYYDLRKSTYQEIK